MNLSEYYREYHMDNKIYQVNLYRDGEIVILLERQCKNRHEMEEIAREYIRQGYAQSMGAIGEMN